MIYTKFRVYSRVSVVVIGPMLRKILSIVWKANINMPCLNHHYLLCKGTSQKPSYGIYNYYLFFHPVGRHYCVGIVCTFMKTHTHTII